MSQEINLLNPVLRRTRDWLSFDYVGPVGLLAVVLVGALSAYASLTLSGAQHTHASLVAQLQATQQELAATEATLAARKGDPALEQEALLLTSAVRQRKEVYRLAEGSTADGSGGAAEVMRGFSRQIVEGVWLTGFSVGPGNFEIRGRLLDPSLLPSYIRRLNSEPAFRGRRFAALDMRAVGDEPVAPASSSLPAVLTAPAPAVSLPAAPGAGVRYTEFALRATAAARPPEERQ